MSYFTYIKRPYNWYEKICLFCAKLIKVKLDKETEEKLQELLDFCSLRIPAYSIYSAILILSIFLFPIAFLLLFLFGSNAFIAFLMFFAAFIVWFYNYPNLKAKEIRAKASSEMLFSTLLMAISLRQVPNLERAVLSVALNLDGPIGNDFKDALMDFYSGKYSTIKNALKKRIDKWYKEANEFVEGIYMFFDYVEKPYKNEKIIDEVIENLINQTTERFEKYSRKLKLPTMIVMTLGIILPILTMTFIPLIIFFLPNLVNVSAIFFTYDFILPLILYWVIISVLKSRPLTSSSTEIIGINVFEFKLFNKKFNFLIVSAIISFILILLILPTFVYENKKYFLCASWANEKFEEAKKPIDLKENKEYCKELLFNYEYFSILGILILLFLTLPFLTFSYFRLKELIKRRTKIKDVERELGEALFQLGYHLRAGTPIENALNNSIKNLEKFKIKNFYEKILTNLQLGYTFEKAIYDEKVGAIRQYYSRLIDFIFRSLLESIKKGYYFASNALLISSKYLKSLAKLQNTIDEIVSDPVSTLKFVSRLLAPIVSAVIIGLLIIILGIFSILPTLVVVSESGKVSLPSSLPILSFKVPTISPSYFVLAIGIFLILLSYIVSVFINGLENGYDPILELYYVSKAIFFSITIYCIGIIIVYHIFGNLILSLVLSTLQL